MIGNGIACRDVENAGGGAACNIEYRATRGIESDGAEEQILERVDRLVGIEEVDPIFEERKI